MSAKVNVSSNNKNFDSFIVAFKESRESVINILKIVIEQKSTEEFKQILYIRELENQKIMREFIKNKYYLFVESIQNINESKNIVNVTDEVISQLENNIQNFLFGFARKYLEKIRKKDDLINIKSEKQKLNISYILFAYLNKANKCLEVQQFESTIRLMNMATEKYLKQFSFNTIVYKRGESLINRLRNKITSAIEEKLSNWLVFIVREQNLIGETLYKRLKTQEEKIQNSKSHFSLGGGLDQDKSKAKTNIRSTKNMVDNLLLIRNTANLNYLMNKNSALKSSVLNQADVLEEFDIINMVSNVDLNFLEGAYTIYKKVDIDTKFIEHFINFRQMQLKSLIKIHTTGPDNTNYDFYFYELLGYLIIQLSIYELLPIFYSKRKFEELINLFAKELNSNLSYEFNNLTTFEDYITLQGSIFIFISALDRIGITERVGIDIKLSLIELMKEKTEELNFLLIKKYNNLFLNLLFEEKFMVIEIKSVEEYMKYVTQYSIKLENNQSMYPFKLPYTNFVIEVNENFKKYIDELFRFISPLYSESEYVIINLVKNFYKKINEVFLTYSNFQEGDLNIMLAAHICNNIKYLSKSKEFYSNYVMSKCQGKINNSGNSNIFPDDNLQKTWENYEEIIYESLKNKIRQFMEELLEENWTPDKPNNRPHNYVECLISYLSVIYDSLQNLSQSYIDNCFNDALNFIPKNFFKEFFFVASEVKNFNLYFIENLKFDVDTLERFFHQMGNKGNSLIPLKQLFMFFYNKKIEQFLEKTKIEGVYEIQIKNLVEFFGKYKNVKKNEMKGKISESDIAGLVKKLKEFIK